jgi:hypothetical protein
METSQSDRVAPIILDPLARLAGRERRRADAQINPSPVS